MLKLQNYRLALLTLLLLTTSPTPAQPYSKDEKGLRNLITDLLRMARQKREQDFANLAASLALPNSSQWFPNAFGPEMGQGFAEGYPAITAQIASGIFYSSFLGLNRDGFKKIEVRQFVTPCVPGISDDLFAVLAAQKSETPLYAATATHDEQSRSIGLFAFVDDHFRWLGNIRLANPPPVESGSPRPMEKLSNSSDVLKRVPPIYPQDARAKRITGTVTVRALIGEDGIIRQVMYHSGSCVFAQAAMTAVRQWRYKPEILNGKPVPVLTTIEVSFNLTP